ncbi:DUF7677 family protein [Actinoplanes siamensis]|uniref:DUF7677 family protein n=1 Tax=Actinoplanes siamensis TaxID=1223317 RepID=UPI00403A2151
MRSRSGPGERPAEEHAGSGSHCSRSGCAQGLVKVVAPVRQLNASARVCEQVFAIVTNVLDVDETGQVTNYADAEYRAAQWIRRACDGTRSNGSPPGGKATRVLAG